MKKLGFIISFLLVCFFAFSQVEQTNKNVYGIEVKNKINEVVVQSNLNKTGIDSVRAGTLGGNTDAIMPEDTAAMLLPYALDADLPSAGEDATARAMLQDSLGRYYPKSYGAYDDSTLVSASANVLAFQAAIDAAAANGGGIIDLGDGDYFLNNTVTIGGDNVYIKGTGNGTSVIFTDEDSYREGFHFIIDDGSTQVWHGGVSDMMIHMAEDTMTSIKITRGLYQDIHNVYFKSVSLGNDSTTAIRGVGTGDWCGGVRVFKNTITNVYVGISTDSLTNNWDIHSNRILGNTLKYEGSRGFITESNGSAVSDTHILTDNNFQGWSVCIQNESYWNRFIGNRFEANDTAWISTKSSPAPVRGFFQGNHYATNAGVRVTATSDYNFRNDVGEGLFIPPNISGSVNIELHENYGSYGPYILLTDGAVSATNNILEFRAYGSSSHDNVFGETSLTYEEGTISSDYDLKIGTVNGDSMTFYTSSTERAAIESDGTFNIYGNLTVGGTYPSDFAITDYQPPLLEYWRKTQELSHLPAFEGKDRRNWGLYLGGLEESTERNLRYIVELEERIRELEKLLKE